MREYKNLQFSSMLERCVYVNRSSNDFVFFLLDFYLETENIVAFPFNTIYMAFIFEFTLQKDRIYIKNHCCCMTCIVIPYGNCSFIS